MKELVDALSTIRFLLEQLMDGDDMGNYGYKQLGSLEANIKAVAREYGVEEY